MRTRFVRHRDMREMRDEFLNKIDLEKNYFYKRGRCVTAAYSAHGLIAGSGRNQQRVPGRYTANNCSHLPGKFIAVENIAVGRPE